MKRTVKKILIITLTALVVLVGCGFGITYAVLDANAKEMPKDYTAGREVRFIAHRGLSGEYYENGEEAFRAAADSEFFYGIETDVYFTADGIAVCAHDDNAFENENILITDSLFADMENLPLKENSYGFRGTKICTFETYLKICGASGKAAIIELKQEDMTDEEIVFVIEEARKYCGENFVLICFKKSQIEAAENYDKSVVTQHLSNYGFLGLLSVWDGYNISLTHKVMKKTLVTEAHKRGREVGVWTVNEFEDVKKYAAMGVDYITTNFDFSEEWSALK